MRRQMWVPTGMSEEGFDGLTRLLRYLHMFSFSLFFLGRGLVLFTVRQQSASCSCDSSVIEIWGVLMPVCIGTVETPAFCATSAI